MKMTNGDKFWIGLGIATAIGFGINAIYKKVSSYSKEDIYTIRNNYKKAMENTIKKYAEFENHAPTFLEFGSIWDCLHEVDREQAIFFHIEELSKRYPFLIKIFNEIYDDEMKELEKQVEACRNSDFEYTANDLDADFMKALDDEGIPDGIKDVITSLKEKIDSGEPINTIVLDSVPEHLRDPKITDLYEFDGDSLLSDEEKQTKCEINRGNLKCSTVYPTDDSQLDIRVMSESAAKELLNITGEYVEYTGVDGFIDTGIPSNATTVTSHRPSTDVTITNITHINAEKNEEDVTPKYPKRVKFDDSLIRELEDKLIKDIDEHADNAKTLNHLISKYKNNIMQRGYSEDYADMVIDSLGVGNFKSSVSEDVTEENFFDDIPHPDDVIVKFGNNVTDKLSQMEDNDGEEK